jgi:hypothetical protein
MKLVAGLRVINVSVVVPELCDARAQRIASKTEDVNSERPKSVRLDARLRIKILLSGCLDTKRDNIGVCRELL